MTLLLIVVGTLVAGMGSVWLAALLAYALLSRFTQHLLSLAAGALLATAFTRLLPEAFEHAAEAGLSAQLLFAVLLVGLVFFFLLDKAELWHHGHEHGHLHDELSDASHAHDHAHDHAHVSHGHHHGAHGAHGAHGGGGWAVLLGDSVHAFGDGILIAAAFVADWRLGVATALAVMTHEVPHHIGDLVVLRQTLSQPKGALLRLSMAGAVTAVGGVVGYGLVGAFLAGQQIPAWRLPESEQLIGPTRVLLEQNRLEELESLLGPKAEARLPGMTQRMVPVLESLGVEWSG